MVPANNLLKNLLYSRMDKPWRGNEQFVHDHSLGYILSGEIQFLTANSITTFKAGTVALIRRNQLVKSVKVPPPGGEFRAINIFFSRDILRNYSTDHNLLASGNYNGENLCLLPEDPFIKGFFYSLLPYFNDPDRMTESLIDLKTKEALELILKTEPGLKEMLFDFSEPYKIDLEKFMQQHYMFNVSITDFAQLTGRSRAGFKRDFEKTFNTTPGQWLQQKRLQEAYFLIKEKGIKPSVAYLDVGFENLSHFSVVFKKAFGVAPSRV